MPNLFSRYRAWRKERFYQELLSVDPDTKRCMVISYGKNKTFEEICIWQTQVEFNDKTWTPKPKA